MNYKHLSTEKTVKATARPGSFTAWELSILDQLKEEYFRNNPSVQKQEQIKKEAA